MTNLPADYHLHSRLCRHAEGEPREYVESARRKHVPEVCFTDHAPAPDGYDARYRMTIDQFPTYRQMIADCMGGESDDVLWGVEADYYEGSEGFLSPWLKRQPFDLVLGSIHYIGDWGFDSDSAAARWANVDVKAVWTEYFRLLARLADTRLYDVIGHLDLPKKYGYRPRDAEIKEMAQSALDRVAAAGMAIEINTAGLRKPAREIYPSSLLLELARVRRIPVVFGSDAHTAADVAYAFDTALILAREVGYTECLRFRQRRKQVVPLPTPQPR